MRFLIIKKERAGVFIEKERAGVFGMPAPYERGTPGNGKPACKKKRGSNVANQRIAARN